MPSMLGRGGHPVANAVAAAATAVLMGYGRHAITLAVLGLATLVASVYAAMHVIASLRAARGRAPGAGQTPWPPVAACDTLLTAADRARAQVSHALREALLRRAAAAHEAAGARKAPLPNNRRSATLEAKLQHSVDLFCRDYLANWCVLMMGVCHL